MLTDESSNKQQRTTTTNNNNNNNNNYSVTQDDVQTLTSTHELYRSNLMKLQITEMLREVSVNKRHGKLAALEEHLHSFKALLDAAKPRTMQYKANALLLPEQSCCALRTTAKHSSKLTSPTRVDLIGSYLLDTQVKPAAHVDLAVQMPAAALSSSGSADDTMTTLLNYE
jgi:U3 small nucleolar RNA-associated protein 22